MAAAMCSGGLPALICGRRRIGCSGTTMCLVQVRWVLPGRSPDALEIIGGMIPNQKGKARTQLRQAERDEQSRRRRAELLALPMTPVRLHGYLQAPDQLTRRRQPVASGVGFDSAAWAAWPAGGSQPGVLVTSHQGGGPPAALIQVPTSLRVWFVQPLPAGRILIAAARTPGGQPDAEIWTGDGVLERSGLIGDAAEHVLTTRSGAIWAGYFDEAMGGSGPEGRGLARFTPGLEPE